METLESMLKAVRDFLTFLEQNKQNILNISSVPSVKFHPVPGCSEYTTSLPSAKNDYVAQTPFVLLPKLNENPDISRSVDTYCKTPKSSRPTLNRLNIPCSLSSELYSWCPVGLQVDGDCSLAGIERRPNQMSCRFVVTNRVSYVSENGQIVCTEGNNIYYLRGGFSWTTFCALYPMLLINSPPPGIVDAFSNGFPAHNWRSWTQGLHYFISTASEGIKESVVISSDVQPINMPSPICANRLPKENQYKHILNPTNRDVDLDSFVGNTFRDLEKDLELADPVKTSIQTSHNHSNNKSPIELNDNNNNLSSIDSFSHFTSVSENHYPPLTSIHLSKKLRKSKFIDKNQLNDQNHLINRKSIKQNNQYLLTDKANLRKIKKQTNKSQLRNLLSNHQSLFNDQSDNNNDDNDDDNIDERYRLYTASGKVVDVRQLNRTRSGRIVIPKLDARYEQSVVLNRGHVMGVSRNTDDENRSDYTKLIQTINKSTQILIPILSPLYYPHFWIHAWYRWNRSIRLTNGGGYAFNAAYYRNLLGSTLLNNDQNSFQLPRTNTTPYTGWLTDESIRNALNHIGYSISFDYFYKNLYEIANLWDNNEDFNTS